MAVFLRALRCYPVNIISPVLHTNVPSVPSCIRLEVLRKTIIYQWIAAKTKLWHTRERFQEHDKALGLCCTDTNQHGIPSTTFNVETKTTNFSPRLMTLPVCLTMTEHFLPWLFWESTVFVMSNAARGKVCSKNITAYSCTKLIPVLRHPK